MDTKKINDFLSVKQAAEFLGICCNTLRKWSDRKWIPVYRNPMNGYRLYKKEDLQELLDEIEAEKK